MADIPTPIVVGGSKARVAYAAEAFHRPAAAVLSVAGLIFIIGSMVDVALLWSVQRQPNPQWEFQALATTAEGLPRIVLGVALVFAAMYVRGSTSLLKYRLFGLLLLGMGLMGIAIAGLMVTDFFALRSQVNPEARWLFRSTVLKTLLLSGMYVVFLIPAGVLCLRRPKAT
jgi:hypothetical protein